MSEQVLTTNKAFQVFSRDFVDLSPLRVERAIDSRNWLIGQVEQFPGKDSTFPALFREKNGKMMGSFSRKTKIRPLDDIDLLLVFSADGATYSRYGSEVEISVPNTTKASNLLALSDNGKLNSIRLLNKIKAALKSIPNYSQADIRYNQEAVTLKLKSYEWNFDLVPALFTAPDSMGRDYYIIPDGNGKWKMTDPRIDASRTTELNQYHDRKLLKVIRLLKCWNSRPVAPKIGSYLLENLILNCFNSRSVISSTQEAIKDFFEYLQTAIYSSCADPKGLQGDLNTLDFDTQIKIAIAANNFTSIASEALSYEEKGDHEKAIKEWQKIFGSNFPSYNRG